MPDRSSSGLEVYRGSIACSTFSFTFVVSDDGVGIENVEQAMEPLYTSRPELERSGMGFSFMEAFMDSLTVESEPGKGTTVTMTKSLGTNADASVCVE